jgi:S-adenosyl-L-methionine hydrolase (adenosine-forming)
MSLARDVSPPWRREASATFHGRDLFAPLAARLALDAPPSSLGQEVNPHSLVRLPGAEPVLTGETVTAMVINVDHFGNCVLNLETAAFGAMLAKARNLGLTAPVSVQAHSVFTYDRLEPGDLGLIKGSQGYLELAMNQASAASELGLGLGSAVTFSLDWAR